jgi:hypothetical protein
MKHVVGEQFCVAAHEGWGSFGEMMEGLGLS